MTFKKSRKARKKYSTHIQSFKPSSRSKSPVVALRSEWEYDSNGNKVRLIMK